MMTLILLAVGLAVGLAAGFMIGFIIGVEMRSNKDDERDK